jgi:hypothetical protein
MIYLVAGTGPDLIKIKMALLRRELETRRRWAHLVHIAQHYEESRAVARMEAVGFVERLDRFPGYGRSNP